MTEQDIKDHPAWKLIPDWRYADGMDTIDGRVEYFFVEEISNISNAYCIDCKVSGKVNIEQWQGGWNPIYTDFKSLDEALGTLAVLISTGVAKPFKVYGI